MVEAETRVKLKALYQALSVGPLSPGDPSYADIFTDGSLSEPSIVKLMASQIEFASSETAQLLGGQSGTGKTTLLRTLKQHLEQNSSYKVVICDMEGYLPMTDPVDVVDFLLVAAGALSEALEVPELLGKDPERESYWSRFARWANNGPLMADSDVALAFKTDLTFRERIREQTKARVSGFRSDVHAFMQECLFALRKRHGEDTQLVVIFDGIEHVHGSNSNIDAVADSIERLFWAHADALRIPLVHVVFTVPLWLHLRFPITRRFDAYHQASCVKVHNPAGIETLRKLIQKRGDDDWLEWLLGSPEAFDELALASGGHLGDLFFLLRTVIIDAHDVGVPVPEDRRRHAIDELGASHDQGFTQIDAAWLRHIDETGTLDSNVPLHRIGAFLLFYRNGRGWYGIRPSIRAEILHRAEAWDDEEERSTSTTQAVPAVSVTRIELEQIRCFDHVCLDFEHEGKPADWLLLLGDNAHGKSTSLQAIALGLCAESEVAALIERTSGPLLREGQTCGRITLTVADADGNQYRSVTEVTQDSPREPEQVRRIEWDLPTEQVFVCAYGPNRSRTADQSHTTYSRHDAVRPLFDHEASLQNSELVLRRHDKLSRRRIRQKLFDILMLDPERAKIRYSSIYGLQILGPWSSGDWIFSSVPSLSDGYRSTIQWVLDLIGWLVYADRFVQDENIRGVVLIDELEQHLHPRWQRFIIARLHAQFPRLQFIVSTHTPLLALGLADEERGLLVRLSKDREERIRTQIVDPRVFRGLRADQILTSRLAFGLATTRSPENDDDIARYDELASKPRSESEEQEFAKLGEQLERTQFLGETPYERLVEAAVREALDKLADESPEPIVDEVQEYELRRKLNELFAKETPI
jgi:energy-coupling factor transporter ATP-binding protein EcfA2